LLFLKKTFQRVELLLICCSCQLHITVLQCCCCCCCWCAGGAVLSDVTSWRQVMGDDGWDDGKRRGFQPCSWHSISYSKHCLRSAFLNCNTYNNYCDVHR